MRRATFVAFLCVAATAAGQDLSLESTDTATLFSYPEAGTYAIAANHQWALQRDLHGQSGDRRGFVRFDLPDSLPTIQTAVLRVPLLIGSIAEVVPLTSIDLFVVLYDADDYDPAALTPIQDIYSADNRAIWDDVGGGKLYGLFDMTPIRTDGWNRPGNMLGLRGGNYSSPLYPDPFYYDVPLSSLAIRDINQGGLWSVGASLATDPDAGGFTVIRGPHPATFILELTYGPPPPLGDFTGDGLADQADLDFVLLNWGLVDQQELDAVLLTWGEGLGTASIASVPEANGLVLLSVASLCLAVRRKG